MALTCAATVMAGGAAALAASPAGAAPDSQGWTTNHHDNSRNGVDGSLGSAATPTTTWTSPGLDGAVYAEPLIDNDVVYVATENDTVYALSAQGGTKIWSAHLSSPVPGSTLPCGDISPLGITSTPVIDESLGEIFVVAEQATGPQSNPVQHWMYGLNLATGAVESSRDIDPSAMDPRPQQQRASLALDDGYVLIGFGGLAGDCPDFDGTPYHGWVVAAPEQGGGPLVSYEVGVSEGLDPTTGATQGAVWGPGGPSVDSSGNVYIATGNGGGGDTGSPGLGGFDYGDAVIELTPPTAGLRDANGASFFAPTNWKSDNQSDADLGSTNPILIPNPSGPDLVFQVGKESTAYLLTSGALGGITNSVAQANGCFARGAAAYLAPYVYLPCDGNAMVALKVTTGPSPSLSTGWTAPNGINGSPIIAGGRVWVLDRYDGTLFGLNPSTGGEEAALNLSDGASANFASAAAGDGLLVAPSGTAGTFNVQAWAFPSSASGTYNPLAPARICDTRAVGPGVSANQCNHDGTSPGTLGPDGTLSLKVAGQGGVPAGATAAVLNVTVTDTTAPSFLTVWPETVARPLASNLNWSAGETTANLVQVPVGDGTVELFNAQGSLDVVVDLEGYFAPSTGSGAGLFNPVTPTRICDTRGVGPGIAANQCNGSGRSPGTLSPGETLKVGATGIGGVPSSGVSAVVLNVTVTDTTSPSYLTVWPSDQPRPLASNLNWTAGETIANRVTVPVSTGGTPGQISVYSPLGDLDVVVDVAGWYTDSSNSSAPGYQYTPVNPGRICDTRSALTNPCEGRTLPAGGTDGVSVAGQAAIPSAAKAAVLNLTVVDTTASSYLTVWPDSVAKPLASDLNWAPGQVVPNLDVVQLGGSDGGIDAFNAQGSTDLVVDAEGYYS